MGSSIHEVRPEGGVLNHVKRGDLVRPAGGRSVTESFPRSRPVREPVLFVPLMSPHPCFTFARGLLVLAGLFSAFPLHAQTPAIRWGFDADKGVPRTSVWISGGVLSITPGAGGHAAFMPSAGVGPATPGVLNCAANVYGDGHAAARISSAGSPLLADADLPQFVVTMWVKPFAPAPDQPYARLLNLSPAGDEKGSPGLFVALNNTNLEVGVNGHVSAVRLPEGVFDAGEWTLLAVVYDGFATNPYYSPDMRAAVRADHNTVVMVGGVETGVRLGGSVGLNSGAPSYNQSAGPLAINGLSVAIGDGNGNGARAFRGLIDDVRIYSGLLTLQQIEGARLSAFDAEVK
jgi:hypothetical protein